VYSSTIGPNHFPRVFPYVHPAGSFQKLPAGPGKAIQRETVDFVANNGRLNFLFDFQKKTEHSISNGRYSGLRKRGNLVFFESPSIGGKY